MRKSKQLTKCDFCKYRVGNECVAVSANGTVSATHCREAAFEYSQWLSTQNKYNKKNRNR